MSIDGAEDLSKALLELGSDRAVRATLKRALNNRKTQAMVADARARAPKKTHNLENKINASTTLSRRQRRERGRVAKDNALNSAELYIGPGGRGSGAGVLQEFGTTVRHWKNGKSTGATPPRPFMRPAWESFKDAILKEFATELGAQIEKSAKRIARKQAKLIRQGKK
jgi:HK97 gp10 family phage protein